MKRKLFPLCLAALLLCLAQAGRAQDKKNAPVNHGGKIETRYDGVVRETVVALKRMPVTCQSAKGLQSSLKGVCVSLEAVLHCPGRQLDYVRNATLQLTFETKDWDRRHPLDQRDLTVVADGETIRLGRMRLASQGVGEGWDNTDSKEVLEADIPYDAFKKIAFATYVELSVGRTAFDLREKNLAALRDMNNRVGFNNRQSGGN
jgi:hypothetical protein